VRVQEREEALHRRICNAIREELASLRVCESDNEGHEIEGEAKRRGGKGGEGNWRLDDDDERWEG